MVFFQKNVVTKKKEFLYMYIWHKFDPTTNIFPAFLATRSTLQCGRDSGLFSKRDFAGDDLKNIGSHISGFQREANARFLCFKHKLSLDKGLSLPDMKSIMSFHTRSLGAFSSPFVNPFKGIILNKLYKLTNSGELYSGILFTVWNPFFPSCVRCYAHLDMLMISP